MICETNSSEPENWEKELFLTELFTQTFVCTDTKQLKKNPDRNINQTLRAIFTQCPRKIQEMRNFLRKKLFARKFSGDSDCSFEKCVGKVTPEVQEKSHSKPEINWKFLFFKNRNWPIKTNLCTENRYFSKPRQLISSRQKFFFPQKPKLNEKKINSTQAFIPGTFSSWHVDWNADKRIEHFCPKRPKLSSTDAVTFSKENNNLYPKLLSRQIKCCFESPVENRLPKV